MALFDETNAVRAFPGIILPSTETFFAKLDTMLARIQNELFDLGADLCVPDDGKKLDYEPLRILPSQVERLEKEIDDLNQGPSLIALVSVLPGQSHKVAAHLHLGLGTVRRRADDLIVELKSSMMNM